MSVETMKIKQGSMIIMNLSVDGNSATGKTLILKSIKECLEKHYLWYKYEFKIDTNSRRVKS